MADMAQTVPPTADGTHAQEQEYYEIKKRCFDVLVGGLLALIATPLICLVALYVKVVSPGPAIFAQVRIGRKGKPFTTYKLRSMHHMTLGSLDLAHQNDARIIPGGKLLRGTHLDELPQLWNVLRGDMSLVGPRPRPEEVDHEWIRVHHGYVLRRLVRPGITGPAQLGGRAHTEDEKHKAISLEHDYVLNWSLWRDCLILVMTIPEVLLRKGI